MRSPAVPKLPEPPSIADLAAVPPDWRVLPPGSELWRLYFRASAHPTGWHTFRDFGPLGSRFDHHLPPPRAQERAILYSATSILTCLAELFQDTRAIDVLHQEPWLVGFATLRPVRLLDLTGRWPTRAGASMALNSGPRARARRWSMAIYAAYPQAEGLWYPSSMHANQPSVALYERARDALPSAPFFHRAGRYGPAHPAPPRRRRARLQPDRPSGAVSGPLAPPRPSG
jgi:hypothetical protein